MYAESSTRYHEDSKSRATGNEFHGTVKHAATMGNYLELFDWQFRRSKDLALSWETM